MYKRQDNPDNHLVLVHKLILKVENNEMVLVSEYKSKEYEHILQHEADVDDFLDI